MDVKEDKKPWSEDLMNRRGIALFLTKYLDENNAIKVLNINAGWGSGKTFFVKNWMADLSINRPCVYFNAWENDFCGDPFIALTSAIRDQLGEIIGFKNDLSKTVEKFTTAASKAIVAATPVIANGLIKKISGLDFEILKEAIDSDLAGDVAEKAVEKLIASNRKKLEIVSDFKKVFHQLVLKASSAKADANGSNPVYIFIDELDRSRPTFAVETLERVKHLFETSNCKFIVATDTSQLSHSVKAIYGSGFNGEKYLKRFFDLEFTLDNSDISTWIKSKCPEKYSRDTSLIGVRVSRPDRHQLGGREPSDFLPSTVRGDIGNLNENQTVVLAVALTFGTKLRELEKLIMQISAVSTNVQTIRFHLFWAAYLVFLKDESPDLYDKIISGDYKEAFKELPIRYPTKHLYLGFANLSVHQLAYEYTTRFREGEDSARVSYNTENNSIGYLDRLRGDFSREYTEMSSYPKIIDLAHRLE